MKACLLVVLALVALANAKLFTVFESYDNVPKGWKVLSDVTNSNERIKFSVALNSQNMKQLEGHLYDISNPKSENYGKWWTRDQVVALTAPPMREQLEVQKWLESNGMTVQRNGDFQLVEGRISDVASMLSTHFYRFRNVENDNEVTKLTQYTIPERFDGVIKMVSGLSGFPNDKRRSLKVHTMDSRKRDDTKGKVCPEVIWQLYDMQYTPEVSVFNSSLCLAAYTNVPAYKTTDLSKFEGNTLLPQIQADHIVGRFFNSVPLDESTLDVEYGVGLAENVSIWFWTAEGWLYDFNTEFLASTEYPFVVSMSYGYPEDGQCDIGDCNGRSNQEYTEDVNYQYLAMSMMGVSIVVSSGDQGAQGDFDDKCDNRDEPLSSSFPGCSQYVLSIGATMLDDPSPNDPPTSFQSPYCQQSDCATSRTEKPCSYPDALITTGGGFSIYLDQPFYQTKAVANYLNSGASTPPAKDFDPTKRGYPDVSAVGHNFYIEYFGAETLVDGTSCSAPVWGGILSRLNAARIANKKPVLGFVNPLFYSMVDDDPTYFNDITTGNNDCTEKCCGLGFDSAVGWDPVTGLGSPNYPKILDYISTIG